MSVTSIYMYMYDTSIYMYMYVSDYMLRFPVLLLLSFFITQCQLSNLTNPPPNPNLPVVRLPLIHARRHFNINYQNNNSIVLRSQDIPSTRDSSQLMMVMDHW